jgi:hypothetical protein
VADGIAQKVIALYAVLGGSLGRDLLLAELHLGDAGREGRARALGPGYR